MKFRYRKAVYKILTSKSIELLYVMLIIMFFYIIDTYVLKKGFSLNNYFELKLATSLSITYFIAVFIKWVSKKIERKIEDGLKLTTDYDAVIKQYSADLDKMLVLGLNELPENITFGNSDLLGSNVKNEIFPIIVEYYNSENQPIRVVDFPNKKYELPALIKSNYSNLFNAHKHSVVYNAVNVRLDDIRMKDSSLELVTSRTSYFDSLVTNRAMDHIFSPYLTIRKIFEYDKKISDLSISLMSNHIGINGLLLSNDNKIIFVRRFSHVSIGKNIIGCSLAASLKAKYCLDANGGFNLAGLEKAVKAEIFDELGIRDDKYDFSISKTFVGIYRDLVEGGKPQILFAVRVNLSSNEINTQYRIKCSDKNEKKDLNIDGDKLLFIDIETIRVTKTSISDIVRKKKYESIPAVTSSTALAIRWFKEENHDNY